MNDDRILERALRTHFEARADRTVLDGQLGAVLEATAANRQRPAWLASLRSFRMSATTSPIALPAVPRVAWLFVLLALLLALALGAIYAGRPAGPPINGRIVFGRFDPALGDTVVYTVNPDGSHVVNVRPEIHEGPFWSPDGQQLGLGHAVANADGSNYRVWDQSGNAFHIECWDWSPDGARMLCEGFADDVVANVTIHGVYTVRASDGQDMLRLSRPGDNGIPQAYSPDGMTVAYIGTASDGASSALLLVDTNGTNLRRLGTLKNVDTAAWAPDGASILATSGGHLYSVELAGGSATAVTLKADPGAAIGGAIWSPDGTRILLKRYISGSGNDPNFDLFTMLPDGTNVVQVTSDPDDDRFIDWGVHPLEH